MTMPGTVRAAQVLLFVMVGLVALRIALAGDPEKAGEITGASFPVIIGFVCALRFGKSKSRTTTIVAASLMIAIAFHAMGQGQPAGLVDLVIGITIVVLLSLRQSAQWFHRARS